MGADGQGLRRDLASGMLPIPDARASHDNGLAEAADIETSSDDYARRFSGGVGRWFLETQTRLTLKLLRELLVVAPSVPWEDPFDPVISRPSIGEACTRAMSHFAVAGGRASTVACEPAAESRTSGW